MEYITEDESKLLLLVEFQVGEYGKYCQYSIALQYLILVLSILFENSDSAFIVCGLNVPKDTLGGFRYRENGKKVVVLIDKKEKILEELEEYSINRATLFPEIESVSAYLKSKYS